MSEVKANEDSKCMDGDGVVKDQTEEKQGPKNVEKTEALGGKPPELPSDLSTKTRNEEGGQEHGSVVAAHYNTLEEKGLAERCKSRIFYLRNFNNWVKSMLINEYLTKIWQSKPRGSSVRVLDMCCGKGGDLLKWRRGNITHLLCADIAGVSVEQCQSRYADLQNRSRHEHGFAPVFTAEFITADCTKVRLRERYKDPSMELDLVSCQFSFHYCFESLTQADCMLRNAAECLRPGGYFIGTIPDAYEIVHRQQQTGGSSFGNDVYRVRFQCDMNQPLPLFGAKYDFHLEGVVDCPEFLVHFPTLVKLAEKHGLSLLAKERFEEYYEKLKEEGRSLLGKMQTFETYPPYHEVPLLGKDPEDYEHVQQYMLKSTGHRKVGTLSKPEWEAATLYLVFAFQKGKNKPEERSKGGEASKKRRLEDNGNHSESKTAKLSDSLAAKSEKHSEMS